MRSAVIPLVASLLMAVSGCGAQPSQTPPQSSRPPAPTTASATVPPSSSASVAPAETPRGPQLQGYLATGAGYSWAYFLSWTRSGDAAQGSIYYAQSSGGSDPTEQSGTSTLTATISGSAVSVAFDTLTLGGVSQLQGTLSGGTLTIEVPQQDGTLAPMVFSKGTQANYNATVGAINAGISAGDQAYQTQQQMQKNAQAAQQALQALNSALQDASTFGSWAKDNPPYFSQVLAAYAAAWSQMQAVWKTEQVDFARASTPNDCAQVSNDSAQVGNDQAAVENYDAAFQSAIDALDPLSNEQQTAAAITGLYQALQSAAAAPGATVAVPAASTIQAHVAAADQGIAAYQAALGQVQAQVSQYDTKANSVDQQAQQLAGKCSY